MMSDRKKELLEIVGDDVALIPLVDEMLYLEGQLEIYRELPKIKVHPTDKSKQKATPAAKLYKEYLQQYVNVVKLLVKATGADESEEVSPLRKWLDERMD